MGERVLKQVFLYLKSEKENTVQALSEKLEAEGLLIRQLPCENLEEACKLPTLFVTDCEEMADCLVKAALPVLVCLNEKNRALAFSGVRFLAEGTEGLEASYLEQVYRREKGLPLELLTTKRCIVRETEEADLDAFYEIYSEPAITRYMENLFADREEERRYLKAYRQMYEFYGFGIWTVLEKETGKVIGRAGITTREGTDTIELGFVIGMPWQQKGIAHEVCEAILQYAESELNLQEIYAYVEPDNCISRHFLEKLGFARQDDYTENEKYYLRYYRTLEKNKCLC